MKVTVTKEVEIKSTTIAEGILDGFIEVLDNEIADFLIAEDVDVCDAIDACNALTNKEKIEILEHIIFKLQEYHSI